MSKTTETDTFRRLKAFMKDFDGDQRQIIKCLQDQVEYLLEKNRICEDLKHLPEVNRALRTILNSKQRIAVRETQL